MSSVSIKNDTMQLILKSVDEINSLNDSVYSAIDYNDFAESLLQATAKVNCEHLILNDEDYREYVEDENAIRPIKTEPDALDFTTLTTVGEVQAAKFNYDLAKEEYLTEQGAIAGIKELIVKNVHEAVLKTLKHPKHGFANVTILQMLEEVSGAADEPEAFDVNAELDKYYEMPDLHSGKPLKIVFVEKETLKTQLNTAHPNPVPDHGALQVKLLAHLKKESEFSKDVETWENKPADERTWEEFVTFFTASDNKRSKHNQYASGSTTAGNSQYGANHVEDLIERKLAAGLASVAAAVDESIDQGIEQALAAKAGGPPTTKTTSSFGTTKDKQKIEELEKKIKEYEDKAAKAKERRAKQVKMTDKCPHCNRMHKYIAAERCYGHPDFSGTVPAGWKPAEL